MKVFQKAEIQLKIGNTYCVLSQYIGPIDNCKLAIKAYEEALKVYTLDRFPMDYAITQNNLGNAYRTLAEVEEKAANCKLGIKASKEALKKFTKREFPEIYPLEEQNLRKLHFCRSE